MSNKRGFPAAWKPHTTHKVQRNKSHRNSGTLPQIVCMLGHEWKVAKTYKTLWGQILLMMFLPGIAGFAVCIPGACSAPLGHSVLYSKQGAGFRSIRSLAVCDKCFMFYACTGKSRQAGVA